MSIRLRAIDSKCKVVSAEMVARKEVHRMALRARVESVSHRTGMDTVDRVSVEAVR